MELIKSINRFKSGAWKIELNRPLITEEDFAEFEERCNKHYKKYKKGGSRRCQRKQKS